MKVNKKKKVYKQPKIVYEKKIETLAVTCTSAYNVPGGCQHPDGSCVPPDKNVML